MREKNICKFIPAALPSVLDVHNFVYESDPHIMMNPVVFPHHRVILIMSGKGSLTCGTQQKTVSCGMLIFSFAGESFSAQALPDLEYSYISFEGTRATDLFRRFGIHTENRCFNGFEWMIPMWRESLIHASEENTDLCAESMLLYAFSRLSGKDAKKNNIVQKMIAISEESFTDQELSLATLAEELNYNAKYLSHIFKEKMGVSYTEYLRTLRIKYAVTLFDHGIDSIKNVAFLCGFHDPLYFSSVFKQIIGVSPKEYRNKKGI